jgi:hypothetical protein
VRMTTKVTSPFQPLAVGDELGRHADLEVARLCVVAESRDIDLARFTGASRESVARLQLASRTSTWLKPAGTERTPRKARGRIAVVLKNP